ncbi:RNA-directed DNA polymerase from mobile element jockey [Elysia marginata]|uniref:RNA-directed DNA polymerase from mobile element jockey n=1 Tax=Elysia marginata TaxID=1093978 RepID=A0AAV4IA89_9GAST|nr:RNA-directed DNA polymerase from mobile element jockey [Elysia marginata]
MNTAQLKLSGNMQKDAKAFNQAIIDAAKVSIPRGYRKNYKPYWTPALERLHKDLGLLKDKLIQEPSDANTIAYNRAHLGPHALSTLLDLFNNSWRMGCVPEVWKEAHIIPIHKKGKSKTDPISYRPISLISCVGKLLEKIINKRLMYHLETNGIISPTQSGFRKNKTTEDQLTYFVQNIENAFQEQKSMLSVYQGYIRPVMEYASPAWSTAATSNLTSLSKTQNQNLRIVLGTIKSTPIKELHKQAQMDTLENRREQRTLTLYEKSKRNPTHPLHNILREKTKNRLKSRKSPKHVMKETFEENQDLLRQTDRYESLKLAESPWENNKVSISYTIRGIERKDEEDTNNLKVKTLEHIDNTYPHDTWTHIYTDGSSDNMKAGGAGIHIWHSDGSKEDISKATGSICSNFKAEVIAIKTALEHIQANQDNSGEEQKYIIF